jgi:hypothetical protein
MMKKGIVTVGGSPFFATEILEPFSIAKRFQTSKKALERKKDLGALPQTLPSF